MRRGQPSHTSCLVTLMRAMAHAGLTEVKDFHDPTAMALLPARWRVPGEAALRLLRARPQVRQRILAGARGRLDGVTLRTKMLDQAWSTAHAAGVRQLVLLGAGLDGRAFRLSDVGDTHVFEVDHPATQALKRKRAAALVCRAESLAFVPVEFERDDLAARLHAAGHRQDQPTFWLWEGVVPYLTPAAQKATLAVVVQRSAPKSRLAMTYVEPGHRMLGIRLLVRSLGEPFKSFMTAAMAAQRLAYAGLEMIQDSGPDAWYASFADGVGYRGGPVRERIAIAGPAA